jgi:hypothetical protein
MPKSRHVRNWLLIGVLSNRHLLFETIEPSHHGNGDLKEWAVEAAGSIRPLEFFENELLILTV